MKLHYIIDEDLLDEQMRLQVGAVLVALALDIKHFPFEEMKTKAPVHLQWHPDFELDRMVHDEETILFVFESNGFTHGLYFERTDEIDWAECGF